MSNYTIQAGSGPIIITIENGSIKIVIPGAETEPDTQEPDVPVDSPVEETNPSGQISFVGRNLYNSEGIRIVPRGPEMTMASLSAISDLDNIAATGANAVRVLLCSDAVNGMTSAMYDQFFARLVEHKMIAWVSFYTWNSEDNYAISPELGGGNFFNQTAPEGYGVCSPDNHTACYLSMWSRKWVKELMEKYKANIIIDAMQEYIAPTGISADSDVGRAAWRDASLLAISFFRKNGYTHPLAIMASFQGRDLHGILQHAQEILDADTVKVNGQSQIIFGWQAYWSPVGNSWYRDWQGSLILGNGRSLSAEEAIRTILPTLNYPIQCGFDNYAGDTAGDYGIQIRAAASGNIPWLFWDWRNGRLDCPLNGETCRNFVMTNSTGFAGARTALA